MQVRNGVVKVIYNELCLTILNAIPANGQYIMKKYLIIYEDFFGEMPIQAFYVNDIDELKNKMTNDYKVEIDVNDIDQKLLL
jgi:hypothetical protein